MVVLAAPGSGVGRKIESLGDELHGKSFNIHAAIKEAKLGDGKLNLVDDAKLEDIVQKWIPELKSLDHNRVLFGYPRTMEQVHFLRKNKIYPNKIFIINSDNDEVERNLAQKLFGKDEATTKKEKTAIADVLQEYKG